MKSFKLYIILFFFYSNVNSQVSRFGRVIYQYDIQEENFGENEKNQNLVNKFKRNLKENKDKIKYELLFSNGEANYKLIKNLNTEKNNTLNFVILLTGGTEEVYTNLKEEVSFKKVDFLGDFFIVKSNLKKEWIFTQETKIIGGYNCFKAILKKKKNKIKKPDIVAWYSPEIPIGFGPKGYCNLPGLIIELKVGPIIYFATKIELNPKEEIEVKKVTNGKLVTEEEFDNIVMRIDKKKERETKRRN
jgi:GLPGLI family protein